MKKFLLSLFLILTTPALSSPSKLVDRAVLLGTYVVDFKDLCKTAAGRQQSHAVLEEIKQVITQYEDVLTKTLAMLQPYQKNQKQQWVYNVVHANLKKIGSPQIQANERAWQQAGCFK